MTGQQQADLESSLNPLVGYLYDCLAAQLEWGRSVNVLAGKDVTTFNIAF